MRTKPQSRLASIMRAIRIDADRLSGTLQIFFFHPFQAHYSLHMGPVIQTVLYYKTLNSLSHHQPSNEDSGMSGVEGKCRACLL